LASAVLAKAGFQVAIRGKCFVEGHFDHTGWPVTMFGNMDFTSPSFVGWNIFRAVVPV
jgi:hypothetical protein